MIVYKKYFFDAAHYLPGPQENNSYSKMHGHSYEITIKISGKIDKKKNWVLDLEKLDSIVEPEIFTLDHSVLNEIEGLEKPTGENIAKWLWSKLILKINNLESIEVNRPRIGGCIYNGR
tara:strand:+ start:111 stop:467 length:357 start_codon:yes stop_codon:yes gene_type:complete